VSHYRIYPTPEQEQALLAHCSHARYVWNLAVEQHAWWHPGRTGAPAFFTGTHGRPSWRKAGRDEGFRITGQRGRQWDVRRVGRHWGEVSIPKAGWVRFRRSRPVPGGVKSFRITRDRAGRWHLAFAHIPDPIDSPGNGQTVGVDRGVATSAALSTGEMLTVPGLSTGEQRRLGHLQRKLARARKGSGRRGKVKTAIAKLKVREKDRRRDWCEKVTARGGHQAAGPVNREPQLLLPSA
jgi:putative transposase